jgi:hypothetical protein
MQVAQSFGFNDWNRIPFASDRLPCPISSTDLRAAINVFIAKPVGFFCDMGVGFMPAPRNGFSDPAEQAAYALGSHYYTKEVTIENGYQSASAQFKMTIGLLGKFYLADKLSVSPGFGIGFMVLSTPTCEAVIKEKDSNMQYTARYNWFGQEGRDSNGNNYGSSNVSSSYNNAYNDVNNSVALGYLAGRLRFAYNIAPKVDLLFGVEYDWLFTRADFSETYTNYFNHNMVKTNIYEGNRLSMAGFSLGISFHISRELSRNFLNSNFY